MSTPAPPSNPLVLRRRFGDFEAFREAMGAWDLDFRQLDRGPLAAELVHLVTPTVLLARSSFSRKLDQNGAPPRGYRTFGIPAHDDVRVRWRGGDYDGRTIMLFPRSGELDSVSEAGFAVYTVSVAEDRLQEAIRWREVPSIEHLFPASGVIHYPAPRRARLRALAHRLIEASVAPANFPARSALRRDLEDVLIEEVLDAVTHGREVGARPMARSRTRILRKALQVIADRAADPVTVAEIQRETGASVRTLRYAFEEEFGLSPKRYLQSYRLNRVRRELAVAEPATGVVSDAANAWGFWHMGQFAADYRDLFGELPSETLRRG